jgi:uncharacterized membrane protein YGL010W
MARPTPKLMMFFQDYEGFHRTPGNKACHYVGIPLIFVAIQGLMSRVAVPVIYSPAFLAPFGGLTLGLFVSLAVMVWYFTVDWKVAIPFSILMLITLVLSVQIPVWGLWGMFIGGWIVQYVGHYVYEKKSPAFYTNLEHLLVGPLWIFARLIGYISKK